jgi:hypothetical protein
MKAGNADRIAKCARGPLQFRRAALNFWNLIISFIFGILRLTPEFSLPFAPLLFQGPLYLLGQE